jgi:hypothetical protein
VIAGPAVFICDECIQVCVDIMADDHRFERDAVASADAEGETSSRSPSATCTLCRMPVLLEDALLVENRVLLCRPCVSAIEAALTQADTMTASPDENP